MHRMLLPTSQLLLRPGCYVSISALSNSILTIRPASTIPHFKTVFEKTEPELSLLSGVRTYDSHIPTTPLQRTLLSFCTGIGCFLRPHRADLISVFGEVTAKSALIRMYDIMLSDPNGRRILQNRPRIRTDTIDLMYLGRLPKGTFGRAYAEFLKTYTYSPDERHLVHFVDDPDLAYIMLRYREVHDLVHTLLEQPTNMLGEVVVKWVEGIQSGLPMCLTGGYFGALRLKPKQTQRYLQTHLEYAIKVATQGSKLICVYFEEHWEDEMTDFRNHLNIPHPPVIIPHKS